jgi:hypothetical protein
MDKGLSVVLESRRLAGGAFGATQRGQLHIRCREPPSPRQRPEAGNESKVSKPLNVQRQKPRCITERLAGGVKGLTAHFDVLLVTMSVSATERGENR